MFGRWTKLLPMVIVLAPMVAPLAADNLLDARRERIEKMSPAEREELRRKQMRRMMV